MPRLDQDAPRRLPSVVESMSMGPPPMSIRFSLPPAKKPIDRLSGDQNGYLAPSVPVNGRASAESSDLSHSRGWPSPEATNVSCLLSGESAKDIGSSVAGVTMSVRISGASGAVRKYGRPT